jgi:osmotically inducible protein OsmC
MDIKRRGSARWSGGLKDGKGRLSTQSGALKELPYGFGSRFEGEPGTNPEELIGAAHAGCFTMALSSILGQEGLTATQLDTTAAVTLKQSGQGFEISAVHLTLEGKVPNTDAETFQKLAQKAKENCPVSKLLKADISLEAKLVT